MRYSRHDEAKAWSLCTLYAHDSGLGACCKNADIRWCCVMQGVPACIEKLRHAGLKIWVLTGDKVPTFNAPLIRPTQGLSGV